MNLLKKLSQKTDNLIKKWNGTGLLCDLRQEEKGKMSQLLENQTNVFLQELDFTNFNSEFLTKVFPNCIAALRRIFGEQNQLDFTWDAADLPRLIEYGMFPKTDKLKTRYEYKTYLNDYKNLAVDPEVDHVNDFAIRFRSELNQKFQNKHVIFYQPILGSRLNGNVFGLMTRYYTS